MLQSVFIEVFAQQDLNSTNCSGAVPGCVTPDFFISSDNSLDIPDFGTGTVSNPSTNPNNSPGNQGCLLSGETTSTFITISVVSTGVLEWSIQGQNTGCFDWIMWPYNDQTCASLQASTLPPVACNWNGACGGFTGMSSPGNLPNGADQSDFENGINVVAGETYLLCLSNYSSTDQNVNMSFFGSADVSCTPSTPDQTTCLGTPVIVDVTIPGVISPSFNWLVTTGVSDPTSGTGVVVDPPATTEYIVEITENDPGASFGFVTTDTFTIYVEVPPTPNAGLDRAICLGDPIQLNGVQSNSANSIIWYHVASGVIGNPTVSYAPNYLNPTPIVTVDLPGTYDFILRESNAICGNFLDTITVVVSELDVTATSTPPSCGGLLDGTITIDSPDAVSFSFDNGNSWVNTNTQNTFGQGQYTVCGKSVLGCETCIVVDVVEPITITIDVSNDTLICQNGTGHLVSEVVTGSGNAFDFHWSHTNDLSAQQDVNPISDTWYSVYAQNPAGCVSALDSIYVTVREPLTGTISEWDTVCPTYSTNVLATVTGGIGAPYSYDWSTSDAFTGTGMHSIQVTPDVTTIYTVTITDACESTPLVLTTQVRVAPLPVPQYMITNPIQCEPAVFEIINTTDPTMSQYNYWLLDGDYAFVNEDTIYSPALMGGLYDLQMIVTSYEGCVDSMSFADAMEVQFKPVANFNHSPNPVKMFNTDVFFQNNSINGDTYQWFFESGSPSYSSENSPHISFPDGEAGTYDVRLITTSALGCVDTMDYELIVFPEVIIYAPNTFTPDGDEHNQNWRVHMEGVDKADFELLVFNRWGEMVWESHDMTIGWDGTYNGKILPVGTYTWIIRTKDLLNDNIYTYNGSVNILR